MSESFTGPARGMERPRRRPRRPGCHGPVRSWPGPGPTGTVTVAARPPRDRGTVGPARLPGAGRPCQCRRRSSSSSQWPRSSFRNSDRPERDGGLGRRPASGPAGPSWHGRAGRRRRARVTLLARHVTVTGARGVTVVTVTAHRHCPAPTRPGRRRRPPAAAASTAGATP